MKLSQTQFEYLSTQHALIQSLIPWVEIFFVWWAMRDCLLTLTDHPNDIDCACDADPDLMRASIQSWIASNANPSDSADTPRSVFRSEKFGTITCIHHTSWHNLTPVQFEITPFRRESSYSDNRHPDSVERSHSLEEDAARRDFTINSIYRTPTKNTYGSGAETTEWDPWSLWTILDPQSWIPDLEAWVLRAVWDPKVRFNEDALRIIRWVRQIISLNQSLTSDSKQNDGFDFHKPTRRAMKAYAHLVESLATERLGNEVLKAFSTSNPFWFVALIRELWALDHLFPALIPLIWNIQPARHHPFDTFDHTLLTLRALQERIEISPAATLAMLYHDTGKPEQYASMERAIEKNPDCPDRSWVIHHSILSIDHLHKDLKRLSISKSIRDEAAWYILHHHDAEHILNSAPKKHDRKLRALISEWWIERTTMLFEIICADRTGQYNPIQPASLGQIIQLQKRCLELYASEWQFTRQQLAIGGSTLMQELGIQPWPQLGILLWQLFERSLWDVNARNHPWVLLDHARRLYWNW